MIRNAITPEDVCKLLNEASATDRRAIASLFEVRTPCNGQLGDHPSIQVGRIPSQVVDVASGEELPSTYVVGFLGLLNGLFGTFESGPLKDQGCIVMTERHVDGKLHSVGFAVRDANGDITQPPIGWGIETVDGTTRPFPYYTNEEVVGGENFWPTREGAEEACERVNA